jgi:hypothetical protein
MFTRKNWVFGEFHDELVKLSLGYFGLFLAQGRQRQYHL